MNHSIKFVCAGALLLASALPSRAVVLKQNWQAGQKLNYLVNLSGTVNLQTPADANFPAAGVPIEAQLQGRGNALLNTLKVDDNGTGTVTVEVPSFTLNADLPALAFVPGGVKAQWQIKDGQSVVSLNGKTLDMKAPPIGAPQTALQLGADGGLKGFTPLKPGDAPKGKQAFEQGVMIAAILKALPSLWPGRDVQVGDTWDANIDFPGLSRPAKDGETPVPLGAFKLKLEGPEEVNGQTLQRVAIKGDIDLDGKTLESVFPPAPAPALQQTADKPKAPQMRLDHFRQTLDGHLWFDPARGQVAKASLILGNRTQASARSVDGRPGDPSWFDFTGTLNMNLQGN